MALCNATEIYYCRDGQVWQTHADSISEQIPVRIRKYRIYTGKTLVPISTEYDYAIEVIFGYSKKRVIMMFGV